MLLYEYTKEKRRRRYLIMITHPSSINAVNSELFPSALSYGLSCIMITHTLGEWKSRMIMIFKSFFKAEVNRTVFM